MSQIVRQIVAADDALQSHRRRMLVIAGSLQDRSASKQRAEASAVACTDCALYGASGRSGVHAGRRETAAAQWFVRRLCALAIGCSQGHSEVAGGGMGAAGLREDGDAEAVQRAAERWMLACSGGPDAMEPGWKVQL